jgi:hypothetical protein
MENVDKNGEALALAEEILKNIELDEIPLSRVCLKTARLSRLIGDLQNIETFSSWSANCAQTEAYLESAKLQLNAAVDRPISVSSANPHQYVSAPAGNGLERMGLRKGIESAQKGYQSYSSQIYKYVLDVCFNKKYSGTAQEIFENTRKLVDTGLIHKMPESTKKMVAISNNLNSDNPEDWANAVHLCRKLLQGLADVLLPPTAKGSIRTTKKGNKIALGQNNYINRLVCYIEDQKASSTFEKVVKNGLEYIGNHLDAVYEASNKGSHSNLSKIEAERYVIYTYLIIGDIFLLSEGKIENT